SLDFFLMIRTCINFDSFSLYFVKFTSYANCNWIRILSTLIVRILRLIIFFFNIRPIITYVPGMIYDKIRKAVQFTSVRLAWKEVLSCKALYWNYFLRR